MTLPELGARYRNGKWLFATALFDVYAGTDGELDRPVHLRFVVPRFARNRDTADAVVAAAQRAAPLVHENLVTIYDVGLLGGRLCVVTEAPAHRLATRRAPFTVDEQRGLARDCLAGLDAAHSVGLFHGDIDEDAVFVTSHGTGKVADVGLFAAVASVEPRLQARQLSVDGDLYRLAAAITRRNEGEVDPVFARALSANPADRYGSAMAMQAAFDFDENVEQPVTAIPLRPETPLEAGPAPVGKPVGAPRWNLTPLRRAAASVVMQVAVVVAVLAALIAISWRDTDPPTPGRSRDTANRTLPVEVPR